jgi:uncharacterized protein YyaL (SSP411 family)
MSLVRFSRLLLGLCALGCAAGQPRVESAGRTSVAWNEWSAEAFDRARVERKLILVSVQAGWCHWCHVMNAETLGDPDVIEVLDRHFVAIRVDADSRPDLAERYQRWAWPATALLTPDAEPITNLRGHQPEARFLALLRSVVERHARGESFESIEIEAAPVADADIAAIRTNAEAQLASFWDEREGGWGTPQKYPWREPIEYSFYRSAIHGDPEARSRALRSLEGYSALIDRVWGGMFQYSVRGTWREPHYEKIAQVQAGAIGAFAEAYRVTGDERWLRDANDVARYVTGLLADPNGGFYASQDADVGSHGEASHVNGAEFYRLDDAGRRGIGAPRIDEHVYANLNGMLIEALVELYESGGDRAILEAALRAADRVFEENTRGAGLAHAATDPRDAELHLGDQAWMIRASLALYEATGDGRWRDRALALSSFVRAELAADGGGFYAHTEDEDARGVFARRRIPFVENAVYARALVRLAHLTNDDAYLASARGALVAVSDRAYVASFGRKVGEYLLALEELEGPHVIVSIVGEDDERTEALHRAALGWYHPPRIVELGRPGASRYPYPGEPAVYLCTATACSRPIYDPARLVPEAERFVRP